jgi:hypothetical protein
MRKPFIPAFVLLLCISGLAHAAETEKLTDFTAHSDAQIEAFVQKHKQQTISTLRVRIDWKKCSALAIATIGELTSVKKIALSGDTPESFEERDGSYFFKPINAPDSFAEALSKIKTLKRIDIWNGCFSDRHRETIKKALPECEINEHMNKL